MKKTFSPVVTMIIMIFLTIIVSFVLSLINFDGTTTIISNGILETSVVVVKNIFSKEGISYFFSNVINNFNLLEPLVLIILSLISFSVAKESGLLKHVFNPLKKLKLTTYQFMKSMILDFFFFFLMCFIPFFFINQNFAIWIALFLSLTNLIPYVGPYIGGIPVVIYEFFIDQHLGYASLIVIMVLQYLESSYLQPYLFSKGIHLHPILL